MVNLVELVLLVNIENSTSTSGYKPLVGLEMLIYCYVLDIIESLQPHISFVQT